MESRTVLPRMMGSLAHCSDLPESDRNFGGALVTGKEVGLGDFVNKESLKVVLVAILKDIGVCNLKFICHLSFQSVC